MLGLLSVCLEEHRGQSASALLVSASRVAELRLGLVVLLLVDSLLLAEARIIDRLQRTSSLTLGTIVHERFHSLFTLKTCRLHLVKRGVHDLLVH